MSVNTKPHKTALNPIAYIATADMTMHAPSLFIAVSLLFKLSSVAFNLIKTIKISMKFGKNICKRLYMFTKYVPHVKEVKNNIAYLLCYESFWLIRVNSTFDILCKEIELNLDLFWL